MGRNKYLAHEIFSFFKSVLNICLIKAQKANLSSKNCVSVYQKN